MKRLLSLISAAGIVLLISCGPEQVPEKGVRIGITYGWVQAISERVNRDINGEYCSAIAEYGGIPVKLSVYDDPEEIDAKLATVKAVLLPGGFDIQPSRYNEEEDEKLESVDKKLDALEYRVLSFAREKKLPVLGICRGHQMINVFHGGSLYQDIPSMFKGLKKVKHRITEEGILYNSAKPCFHDTTLIKGSVLNRSLGTGRIKVNTYHHQAVKKPAPGFIVTARSDDGSVEAIEYAGDRFIMGVQFHPEKMIKRDPVFKEIFRCFMQECSVKTVKAGKKAEKKSVEIL